MNNTNTLRDRHALHAACLAGLIAFTLAAGCGATGANQPSVDVADLVEGNTEFALALYGGVASAADAADDIFLSPLSVSTALVMTYAGARGTTATEMANVLALPAEDPASLLSGYAELDRGFSARAETSGYTLTQANSLWGQEGYPFRDEYLETVSGAFGAEFMTADFVTRTEEARQAINGWVEDETHDRIENLIPPGALDSSAVLVLVNAIYFKGDWARQFDPDRTESATFHSPSGELAVDMMRRTGRYGYAEDDAVQVLDLPYRGGDLSMTVILPKQTSPDALAAVEASLTPENVRLWTDRLNEREVQVFLPRFRIEWGTEELRDDLQTLGMKTAFVRGSADFSGIDGTRDLFISFVLHKAFVEVNEEGSEAAAATAVGIARTSVPTPPPVFRADRPFLFLIRDRASGSILFIGRVASPRGAAAQGSAE
jgi:serpin B